MAAPEFDAERIDERSQYEDLNTVRGRASFIVLVVDYMTYLKSDPARRADRDGPTKMEMKTARKFLDMIDHDRAWPYARQAVQEFRTPAQATDTLPDPLRTIMEGVRHRLVKEESVPSTEDTLLQYEKKLKWRNISLRLEHLASVLGPPSHKKEEVEKALTTLAEAEEILDLDISSL